MGGLQIPHRTEGLFWQSEIRRPRAAVPRDWQALRGLGGTPAVRMTWVSCISERLHTSFNGLSVIPWHIFILCDASSSRLTSRASRSIWRRTSRVTWRSTHAEWSGSDRQYEDLSLSLSFSLFLVDWSVHVHYCKQYAEYRVRRTVFMAHEHECEEHCVRQHQSVSESAPLLSPTPTWLVNVLLQFLNIEHPLERAQRAVANNEEGHWK